MAKGNKGRPNTSVNIDGAKIKKLMAERGMQYQTLSAITGYDRSYINVSIKYERMTGGMLNAVCKALNVSERDIKI